MYSAMITIFATSTSTSLLASIVLLPLPLILLLLLLLPLWILPPPQNKQPQLFIEHSVNFRQILSVYTHLLLSTGYCCAKYILINMSQTDLGLNPSCAVFFAFVSYYLKMIYKVIWENLLIKNVYHLFIQKY